MKLRSRAFTAGIGYTIGNILIKGINFLALPIFSRLMTTEEFGVYNVFLSYDAILFVLIGMALHTSLRSASYKYEGKIDEYTSSVSLVYFINTFFLLIVATIFGGMLSSLLGFDQIIIYLLILYSFGSSILTLYNDRISIDYAYKKYIAIAFLNTIGNLSISLLLMFTVFNNERELGRIFGTTITIFVIAIVLLFLLYRKSLPKYNRDYWKFGIKYSLPIIPHGISQVLLSQFDRIMINKMVGASEAGIYSLGGNIKLLLTTITSSVSASWTTWFYSEIDKGNKKIIQKRAIQLSTFFVVLSIILISISPEIIYFLGGKAYEAGKYIAVPVVLDAFVLALYNIIVPSEYYTEKTIYIMLGTMFAAIINIITNYIFIRMFGYIAAAYTTLFSYTCYLVLHIIISYKLVKFFVIPLKWIFTFGLCMVGISAWNLYFINNIIIRWISCVILLALILILMLKLYFKKNYQNIQTR